MPAGQVLNDEEHGWIDADDQFRPCAEHAQAEISVTAADIQDTVAFQVHVRRDPVPLPVGTPLGIDSLPSKYQRPLAPGMKRHQAIPQVVWNVLIRTKFGRRQVKIRGLPDVRQGIDRRQPPWQVAVGMLAHPFSGQSREFGQPVAIGPMAG